VFASVENVPMQQEMHQHDYRSIQPIESSAHPFFGDLIGKENGSRCLKI
jgi:hypothetical protein